MTNIPRKERRFQKPASSSLRGLPVEWQYFLGAQGKPKQTKGRDNSEFNYG